MKNGLPWYELKLHDFIPVTNGQVISPDARKLEITKAIGHEQYEFKQNPEWVVPECVVSEWWGREWAASEWDVPEWVATKSEGPGWVAPEVDAPEWEAPDGNAPEWEKLLSQKQSSINYKAAQNVF